MAILNYKVACPTCINESLDTPGELMYDSINPEKGFFCGVGHTFSDLPINQTTQVEVKLPNLTVEEPRMHCEVTGIGVIPAVVAALIPPPGEPGGPALPVFLDSHAEVEGDATDLAPNLLASKIPEAVDVKHCEDESVEVLLSSGDVILAITCRADYVMHLRDEAQTQEISLTEFIQRHVNEATENGWW